MKKNNSKHGKSKKTKTLSSKLFKRTSLKKATFSRRQLLLFVTIFAAIGGFVIWRSLAAGTPAPSISLYASLDKAFAGESVEVVWSAKDADSCHGVAGGGKYQGYILALDPSLSKTEGDRSHWGVDNLPTSGIARSDPLYDSNFGNQAGNFTLTCTGVGGTKTVTAPVALQPDSERVDNGTRSFNIHCESVPDVGDPGDNAHVSSNFSHRPVDPIVDPGDSNTRDDAFPTMGHFHDFFGNKLLDENTTPEDLLANLPSYRNPNDPNGWRNTSCNQDNLDQDPTQAGEGRNGSAYWIPSTYVCDGTSSSQQSACDSTKSNLETGDPTSPWGTLTPNFVQIYYRNNSKAVHESFPTGLKMIAGPIWRSDNTDDQTYHDDEQSTWKCVGGYLYTRSQADPDRGSANQVPHCDASKDFSQVLQINFPNCWDGIRLDSETDLWGNPLIGSHGYTGVKPPHVDPITGAGYAHRDHVRTDCTDFTAAEKTRISELGGHVRQFNQLELEVRYNVTYTLNNGTQKPLSKDHVFWYALASRSEAPVDQCSTGTPPSTSAKKECWVQGLPECPDAYDVNHHSLPITCSGPTDNAGHAPVVPKHLVDSSHADYFFGWDPLRLDFLTHECLSSNPECKGNNVGFGMPPGGPNCSDGFDNDGDGKVDWKSDGTGDPNCTSPADNTETPDSAGRTLYFTATPTHTPAGRLVRLSWSAEHVPINVGCEGSSTTDAKWNGAAFVSSNQDVGNPGTYTITCDPCDYGTYTLETCDNPGDPGDPPGHLAPLVKTITIDQDSGGGNINGDVNGDGHVNVVDLSVLLSKFGTSDATCDFNHTGLVDIVDLSILISHYGT